MTEQDLPRERFQAQGAESLNDRELLAVLLRTGIQGKPVLALADELLKRFDDNLLSLSKASVEQLQEISGMGEAKAVGLCAAFALARRLLKLRLAERPLLGNPELIADYIRETVSSRDKEETHVLLLDSQNRLIRDELITIGIMDRALIHPREIFRPAVKEACASFILCHTHPAADAIPSKEDYQVTDTLLLSSEIIGIHMLDHVIVALRPERKKINFYSFRAHELLDHHALLAATGKRSAAINRPLPDVLQKRVSSPSG